MLLPAKNGKLGTALIAFLAIAGLILVPSTANAAKNKRTKAHAAKKSKKRCLTVPATAGGVNPSNANAKISRAPSGGIRIAATRTSAPTYSPSPEGDGQDAAPPAVTPADECGPPGRARLVRGKAIAPPDAPPRVKRVIAWANKIRRKPYVYGGGHARFFDRGYDCSGAVSFALRGGRFIRSPMPSTGYMRWSAPGEGRWITVSAHGGHAYMVVAGLRFDTSMTGGNGPRWSKKMRSSRGFRVRHPAGF